MDGSNSYRRPIRVRPIEVRLYIHLPVYQLPVRVYWVQASMHEISINSNGVEKLLKDLKPYKAPGPDDIPTFILRAASEELAPILSGVYQISLDKGEL